MEDRIKALEEKYDVLESRITQLEAFAGIDDFDAQNSGSTLNRRIDWLEDWRRDLRD